MGAYMGKSAVLIGAHRREDERFVVCDLFGAEAESEQNRAAVKIFANLTREAFEANYRAFHAELPDIIQAPTSHVPHRVTPRSFRFVHVDACHLYNEVVADIATSREVAAEGCVVAFDDFRAPHTPAVAAAVWGAVTHGGLHPICVTPHKLYGSWSDPGDTTAAMMQWLTSTGHRFSRHEVCGKAFIYALDMSAKRPAPSTAAAPLPQSRRVSARRLAVDLLPPLVTRTLRRARAAARG
jgi:hypothetical protein